MKNSSLIIILFSIMACAQIYVPGAMIWNAQKTMREGTVYRFKTRPLDPNDPFKGKYVSLRFEAETLDSTQLSVATERGEHFFAMLDTDSAGYARISSLEKEEPLCDCDYITVQIKRLGGSQGHLHFPFKKYYMEESKARPAELAVARAISKEDSSEVIALVSVLRGEAVMTDILIDGVAIEEVAEAYRDSIFINVSP